MENQTKYEVSGQGFQSFDMGRAIIKAGEKAKNLKDTVMVTSDGKPYCQVFKNGKVVLV